MARDTTRCARNDQSEAQQRGALFDDLVGERATPLTICTMMVILAAGSPVSTRSTSGQSDGGGLGPLTEAASKWLGFYWIVPLVRQLWMHLP